MPRFYVLSGPDLGRSFELREGAVFGRSADCAAPLRSSSISRRHAELVRDGGKWALVDLGSRNGILSDGQRVARLELTDGASFRLGEVELRFRAEEPPAASEVQIAAREPAPHRAAPVRATDARADEIELEEIALEDAEPVAPRRATAASAAPPAALAPAAGSAPRAATPPHAPAARGSVELRDAGRPILQYRRITGRRGFALSDLAQQPAWMKLLVALACIALFVALFYLAFRGTQFVRGRLQGASDTAPAN